MSKQVLELKFICEDDWNRPVYKDQNGRLWIDVECGDLDEPVLHASSNNEIDGEPDYPITQEHVFIDKFKRNPKQFQYMMLSRLQGDCKTHFSAFSPSCRIKTKESKDGIIKEMKALWEQFTESEKPEWITLEEILDYERRFLEEEA